MKKSSAEGCFFCGRPADDASDHVPPEVLFRGASGRDYKIPSIIKVPACRAHNRDMSGEDEALAWFLTAKTSNNAGADVLIALTFAAAKMRKLDYGEAVKRFERQGIRFRDPSEVYDVDGKSHRIEYTQEYFRLTHEKLLRDWQQFVRAIQKIAAGLHFHVTNPPVILGPPLVGLLRVFSPDAKPIDPVRKLTPDYVNEAVFFRSSAEKWGAPKWVTITSGSPDVFICEHAWHKGKPRRFALKMTFYGDFRVWVTSGG